MPIRFRCAYCNQLMGIARRKAGTVVRCPNCAGQVIVPSPGPEQPVPQAVQQPAGVAPAPVLFEGSDFDKLFEPNTVGVPPAVNPQAVSPAPAPQPAPGSGPMPIAAFDVEPIRAPAYQGPGVFLTPVKLTIVSVSIVILLGLAFLVGFLAGRV
jgi:hypothetical protein